jgi:hypothetical protein
MQAAPIVAGIMAIEMRKDENWIEQQVQDFNIIAKNYLPVIN